MPCHAIHLLGHGVQAVGLVPQPGLRLVSVFKLLLNQMARICGFLVRTIASHPMQIVSSLLLVSVLLLLLVLLLV